MGKIIKRNIGLEHIKRVDLMCSQESNEDINNALKRKVNINKGIHKILTESYLFLSYLTNSFVKDIKLDAVRIWTTDDELYVISTYDIIENQITINANAAKLILSALNYVSCQEQANINVLEYNTLDYILYEAESKRSK